LLELDAIVCMVVQALMCVGLSEPQDDELDVEAP
jgi:hypothetical protein